VPEDGTDGVLGHEGFPQPAAPLADDLGGAHAAGDEGVQVRLQQSEPGQGGFDARRRDRRGGAGPEPAALDDLAGDVDEVPALRVGGRQTGGSLGDPQGDGFDVVVETRQQLVHGRLLVPPRLDLRQR
jgi:hypothetical protein